MTLFGKEAATYETPPGASSSGENENFAVPKFQCYIFQWLRINVIPEHTRLIHSGFKCIQIMNISGCFIEG